MVDEICKQGLDWSLLVTSTDDISAFLVMAPNNENPLFGMACGLLPALNLISHKLFCIIYNINYTIYFAIKHGPTSSDG